MLAEHKGLAILFAAILAGFAGYGWKKLSTPRHAAPLTDHRSAPAAPPSPGAASPAQPIYIETLPDQESR